MRGNSTSGWAPRTSLRAASLLVALVACAVWSSSARAAADAATRTLFLTESVTPDAVRGPLAGPVQPEDMVAQPGEEESFQLAIKVPATTRLVATVTPSSDAYLVKWTQVLRAEYVNITRPSTGTSGRKGAFVDPLPPQLGAATTFDAGKLEATGGKWSAFVFVISVPIGEPAGVHAGTIEVRSPDGVVASQSFSVNVVDTKDASGAADPAITPHDKRNYKMLFNFNPAWYRVFAPVGDAQENYEQTYRTLWMLARHRAAPTHWQRAYPVADGTYSCAAADGYLKVFDQMPWWADGKPGGVPVANVPNQATARCDQPDFEMRDQKSKATKFDDTIGDVAKSTAFLKNVAAQWTKSGLIDDRAYFLNPFDEPDGHQNNTVVPEINSIVHQNAPGVKVLGTTWPMVKGRAAKTCRTTTVKAKGKAARKVKRCASNPGQTSSNSVLSDGGDNDLDAFVAPYFRSYGFATTAAQKAAGMSRSREIINRLDAFQAKGGEKWTYDLPLGSSQVPQLSIDSPATDARFMFWTLGRDHFQGFFIAVSNRWIDPVETTKARNPWDAPLSWVGTKSSDADNMGPHGVVSNGWGSLFYPPMRPALGLTDILAQPVASIRLERMRDGVEDANLMTQYRDRFGQKALNARLVSVVGPLRVAKNLPGGETFPSYSNAGLPLRMEIARRTMIADLAQ
jgi:hypothetical protein